MMNKSRVSREIPETAQRFLPLDIPPVEDPEPTSRYALPDNFTKPDPGSIFLGDKSLKSYLKENGFEWVIRLRSLLEDIDYVNFYAAYNSTGRKAIHPQVMLGLIIYGLIEGKSSLRELENLAIRDVGAWWITGGLYPDHSTIGNFINLHKDILSEEFFVELTGMLIKKLRLKSGDVAGDGTVIGAVSSRYKMLTREAAELAAQEALKDAQANPEDRKLQKEAEVSQEVARQAILREAERKAKGKKSSVKVSPTEPDAVLQPLKNGVSRPSYKPSVLANEERFIVGKHVHPTSETAALPDMLLEHKAIYQDKPKFLLLDAGYHSGGLLEFCVDNDIDVLCPSGKADATGNFRRASQDDNLVKNDFEYFPENDIYCCPGGAELVRGYRGKDSKGRRYTCYKAPPEACAACQFKKRCTTSKQGRQLKRYDKDEYKEAMDQVLEHPRAKEKYRKRKGIVEPVFAELRERFGLKRFKRKGLAGVTLEFSLYCTAYNVKKALGMGILEVQVSAQSEESGKTKNIGTILFVFWWNASVYNKF